jgi:hypothetical protein
MLQISFMRAYLNQHISRGWVSINERNHTTTDIHLLERGAESRMLVVERINVDPSAELQTQLDGFFYRLRQLIQLAEVGILALPCGGDVSMPHDFVVFCHQRRVEIKLIRPTDNGAWFGELPEF